MLIWRRKNSSIASSIPVLWISKNLSLITLYSFIMTIPVLLSSSIMVTTLLVICTQDGVRCVLSLLSKPLNLHSPMVPKSRGPKVPCSHSPVVPKSHVHKVSWSHGPKVSWSQSCVVPKSQGPQVSWSKRSMVPMSQGPIFLKSLGPKVHKS